MKEKGNEAVQRLILWIAGQATKRWGFLGSVRLAFEISRRFGPTARLTDLTLLQLRTLAAWLARTMRPKAERKMRRVN